MAYLPVWYSLSHIFIKTRFPDPNIENQHEVIQCSLALILTNLYFTRSISSRVFWVLARPISVYSEFL